MNIAGVLFLLLVLAVVVGIFWAAAALDRRDDRLLAEEWAADPGNVTISDVVISPAGVEFPVGAMSAREILATLSDINEFDGVIA